MREVLSLHKFMLRNVKMMENNLHNVAIDYHIFTTYQNVIKSLVPSFSLITLIDRLTGATLYHCGVKHYVHTITSLKLIVNSEVQRKNATHTDNSQ